MELENYRSMLTFSVVLMVIALGLGGRGVWLLVQPPRAFHREEASPSFISGPRRAKLASDVVRQF